MARSEGRPFQAQAHDFFMPQPPRAYSLHSILHDWGDEDGFDDAGAFCGQGKNGSELEVGCGESRVEGCQYLYISAHCGECDGGGVGLISLMIRGFVM